MSICWDGWKFGTICTEYQPFPLSWSPDYLQSPSDTFISSWSGVAGREEKRNEKKPSRCTCRWASMGKNQHFSRLHFSHLDLICNLRWMHHRCFCAKTAATWTLLQRSVSQRSAWVGLTHDICTSYPYSILHSHIWLFLRGPDNRVASAIIIIYNCNRRIQSFHPRVLEINPQRQKQGGDQVAYTPHSCSFLYLLVFVAGGF